MKYLCVAASMKEKMDCGQRLHPMLKLHLDEMLLASFAERDRLRRLALTM